MKQNINLLHSYSLVLKLFKDILSIFGYSSEMYQIVVCICNIKVSSVRMSGWPVTQMAESPHLQAWHDRVPLLQVSLINEQ